jgi:integrase/recombinase XerD
MATLKLTIDNRRAYSDGRYPIIFRLTSNTKSTSIESGIKLFDKEWDFDKGKVTKTHPNYHNLNLHLKQKLFELEKRLLELNPNISELNVKELKDVLLNKKKTTEINFYDFAIDEINILRKKEKFGNAQSYETAVNRLVKFTGKNLELNKINYTLITDFETQLIQEGLSRNSVAVYMREIRALQNKAIKKGILDSSKYAFSNYKIKTEKTVSRAISKQDIQKIKDIVLDEGTELWHSRNIFILIFNLIGVSFIDLALLQDSSIQDNRVVYRRRKTGKIYSIKLTTEAVRIINIYKKCDSKYLISCFALDNIAKDKEREEIALRLKTCNKYLKRIGRLLELPMLLTTYVARYSWANIAKSLGASKDLIAEALGHNYGNAVTGIYLDEYGNEIIDEMNEKVTKFN